MTVDDFVDMHRRRLPVEVLCAAISHKRSTYYARKRRPGSSRTQRDHKLAKQIAAVRRGYNKARGRRTVVRALRRKGISCSEKVVGRVMRENGWFGAPRARRQRPAIPVQISHRDLVQRQFWASAPNQVWWGDVKEIQTREGELFLSSLQDAYSRYIVGFAFSSNNDTNLTSSALARAVRNRKPGRGMIHHTDRGGPYTSWAYQAQLEQLGALPSVSRPGVPHDNACIESWHSTLQREFLAFHRFETRDQAIREITGWIRHFNKHRFHSTLGYLSPVEHEAHNVA